MQALKQRVEEVLADNGSMAVRLQQLHTDKPHLEAHVASLQARLDATEQAKQQV